MRVADRFAEFFVALYGEPPYRWQRELVAEVAETGRWPDISAPTGSGKSAVVDAHVFLVAEHAGGAAMARPPRRLVLVAPRRVLVDDQYARALHLADRLGRALQEGDEVLARMAVTLSTLQTAQTDGQSPIGVWSLRGGFRLDTGWRREPAACQIVCATPDMWGSRLLLRGYGASPRSRNVEAGLLGQDAVAIVDEAHLNERLVESARATATLDRGPLPLQVVAMSATCGRTSGQRGVEEADLDEGSLSKRVRARKVLRLVDVSGNERDLRRASVDEGLAARERIGESAGTVGVFVNSVIDALSVAAELRRHGETRVVCGRLRPADLARLRCKHPDLLTMRGDPSVEFLVSTQSLEIGVDLDLPAMVTTLAPASALAQRAGRLNRSGRYSPLDPTLTVLVPVDADGELVARGTWIGPYDDETELRAARDWLVNLDGSISPWDVSRSALPLTDPPHLPALRRVDLETLAMTSDPLAADPDPELYIHEPEQERREVAVIARRHVDATDLDSLTVETMLEACPPQSHEIARLAFGRVLERIVSAVGRGAWVLRPDGTRLRAILLAEGELPRAGDTLVVPDGARICTAGVLGIGEVSGDHEPYGDVLEEAEPVSLDQVLRLPTDQIRPIIDDDPVLGSRRARERLADLLRPDGALGRALRRWRLSDLELVWCEGSPDGDGLLVVHDARSDAPETPRIVCDEPVLLDHHQRDVRARLEQIVGALGVEEGVLPAERLAIAAGAHDDGKAHPRFQERMGADLAGKPLAKPRPGHRPDRGNGWRHEQLSAAFAAAGGADDPLTVSLVAGHHGCGRSLFHRDDRDLLEGWDDCDVPVREWAGRLFGPRGEYEMLRARAQAEHGVHGLCWFEALLCCADRQISAEGR